MSELTDAVQALEGEVTLVVQALEDLAAKVSEAADVPAAAQVVRDEVAALKAAVTAAGEDPPTPPAA